MPFKKIIFISLLLSTSLAFSASNTTAIPHVMVYPQKKSYNDNQGHQIITSETLENMGVSSLYDALHYLGVQVRDITGSGSQLTVSMRGFGANASSNSLILLNGIPLANPDLMPINSNQISIHNIESIEIVNGSDSVTYGDQAVGGIINIITKTPKNNSAEGLCDVGSDERRHCYAQWQNHIRQFHYYFGMNLLKDSHEREHNNYREGRITVEGYYPYTLGKLFFDLDINKQHLQYPGALNAMQLQQNRWQATNHTDFFADNDQMLTIRHQHFLKTANVQTVFSWRHQSGDGVLSSPFTQSREVYFLKPQIKQKWKHFFGNGGVELEHDSYQLQSLFGLTDESQQKYGLFASAKYQFLSKWTLSSGGRIAVQHNHLTTTTNSRIHTHSAYANHLGLSYALTPQTQVFWRRADSFRFPKADESATAQKELKTQQATSYEMGMQYAYHQTSALVMAYLLLLDDEIAFDPLKTAATPFGSNKNLSPTSRKGFNLSVSQSYTSKLGWQVKYDAVSAHFQHGLNSNKRIPMVAENVLTAGIYYHIEPAWELHLNALYTGSQFASGDEANVGGELGGYTIYRFNVKYHFKQWRAMFQVNNIFNKYYNLYTIYQPSLQNMFFYPAAGREVLLTLQYLFK